MIYESEWLAVSYILATVLFILALKGLGAEATAMTGCAARPEGNPATLFAASHII